MPAVKEVSFTRKPFGYNDTSYLTKARADKEVEDLNAVKAEIDKRIALLNAVKDVSAIEDKPAMTREEAVKAAKMATRNK